MMLQDKVSIVTGAGSGIGRTTAKLFAEEGSKVVVADINAEGGEETVEMIRDSGGEATFVKADVSSSSDMEKVIGTATEKYGKIDVLFNNAGIELARNVVNTTEEEWDKVININLKGVYLGSKYSIPKMVEAGGGSIINMGSVGGYNGYPNSAAYTASKGGIISLTKTMALDFAEDNVRVNCICPANVETQMPERYIQESENPEEVRHEFESMQPLGRMGKPEEIANLVLFLASDESSYMTGAIIPIDGGYTAK